MDEYIKIIEEFQKKYKETDDIKSINHEILHRIRNNKLKAEAEAMSIILPEKKISNTTIINYEVEPHNRPYSASQNNLSPPAHKKNNQSFDRLDKLCQSCSSSYIF